MKQTNILVIILGILLTVSSCEQPKLDEEIAIDQLINAYLEKDSTIIGLAVGIVRDSSIIYCKTFGTTNVETGQAVNENSQFILASTCKLFTATAILQLVEEKKLNLDSPVVKYLPYFKIQGVDYTNLKVKNLITHTNGLPRHLDYEDDFAANYDETDIECVVRKLEQKNSLVSNYDSLIYKYNGYGFAVASDIVSKVSGIPFTQYVNERIFEPLGMNQLTFRRDTVSIEYFALPHEIKEDTVIVHHNPIASEGGAGTGTAISSIKSMTLWLKAMVDYTNFGAKILKPTIFEQMTRSFVKTGREGDGVFGDQGFGYQIGTFGGDEFFGHGGASYYGSNSLCLVQPDRNIGVVVLTNSNSQEDASLTLDLLNILKGKTPQYLK